MLSSELSSEDGGNTQDLLTNSGAVSESATKSKTSLKARQSMASLEDTVREVIAKDPLKTDQSLPTFDSCVR